MGPLFSGFNTSIPQPTTLRMLDVAPLRDIDDNAGLYWAACGVACAHGWSMSLLRSEDNGQSFQSIDTTNIPAVLGTTLTRLGYAGNPAPGVWDKVNKLTVRVISGELESVDPTRVLANQNIALVGNEIIGFANAVQVDFNGYELSLLLRGMQGTDINMTSHTAADAFTLLSGDGSIHNIDYQLGDLNAQYIYAGVTAGTNLAITPKQRFPMRGNRIKPLPVVHASISRAGNGDATISWVPRRRVGIDWIDSFEQSVDEPVEGYEIDIYDAVFGGVAETIKTWSIVTGTIGSVADQDLGIRRATFTAGEQIAVGLTPVAPALQVTIYETSSRIGRGFGRTLRG